MSAHPQTTSAANADQRLSQLIKLKRLEKPDAAYWEKFEQEFRSRQLTTFVHIQPMHTRLRRACMLVARKAAPPVAAAGAVALTFFTATNVSYLSQAPERDGETAKSNFAQSTDEAEQEAFFVVNVSEAPKSDSEPLSSDTIYQIHSLSNQNGAEGRIPAQRHACYLFSKCSRTDKRYEDSEPSAELLASMLRRIGSTAWIGFSLLAKLVDAAPTDQELRPATIPGEQRLIELYRDYHDCVVKVKFAVKSLDENGKEQVALTVQSGFYIDNKGTVLTNAVPTQKGPRLRIEKDGLQLLAVPIASDSRSNVALLQVAKPPNGIRFVDINQNATEPAIGSLAYAITSPLDLAPTPKLGIVTGRESSFSNIEFPCTYTRIGITSGPAEGGSPVFASDGSLMGVSVASLPDVNSSYIVPTKSLQHIVSQLLEAKRVFHAQIGAKIAEQVNPSDLSQSLVVESIEDGSVAKQSGLLAGDQIASIEGQALSSLNQWRDALFFGRADEFIRLKVRREDQEKEIALLLSDR